MRSARSAFTTSKCRRHRRKSGVCSRTPEPRARPSEGREDRTMYNFTYHRPGSSREAQGLTGQAGEARFLAGGMTLLPAMKLRLAQPSDLIDLSRINDLKGISVTGSELRINAMTTHAEVAESPE